MTTKAEMEATLDEMAEIIANEDLLPREKLVAIEVLLGDDEEGEEDE